MKWMRRRSDARPVGERVALIGHRHYPREMWDYEPVGPNYTIEFTDADGAFGDAERWGDLDAAVARFAEMALPVWPYWHWNIVDDLRTVVLGYSTTDESFSEYGPWGWWVGVEAAFEVLARHHDPMEVAVWETIAKERAWM